MWTTPVPGARRRPEHGVPTRSELAAARRETERRAAELVAAGALDRGNGDVLEPYLAATLASWRARLRACGGPCAHVAGTRVTVHDGPAPTLLPVRADGGPADGPPGRSGTGPKVLLAAAFAGDIANFYIALSAVGNASVVATLFVVVALTAASLGLAHGAGRALRAERTRAAAGGPDGAVGAGGPDRPGRAAIVGMGVLWLAIGLSAATVRLLSPTSVEPSGGAFGADGAFGAVAPAGPDLTNLALTGLFLALFLASGALAAIVGLADDPAAVRRRDERRERRRDGAARTRTARLAAAHAAADERCVAAVDELRSRAMHIVQCELGEPGTTSATTWPVRPARSSA